MRLKSPKQKGDAFERELAAHLRSHLGIDAQRVPLSGGGVGVGRATGDLSGTPLISIEAKHVENLSMSEAMAQAIRNAGADIPVVIHRRNRMATDDARVTLRLKDFLPFYRALLEREGIQCSPTPNAALSVES